MGRLALASRRRRALAVTAAILVVGMIACLSPTQVTVRLYTDVPLGQDGSVAIASGRPGTVSITEPLAVLTGPLTSEGLGTLVRVPGEDDQAGISVIVAFGVGRDPKTCTVNDASRCIIARRRLSFVKHRPLMLPIVLSAACIGVPCDESSTCNALGRCVPSQIDPEACGSEGCVVDGDPPVGDLEGDSGLLTATESGGPSTNDGSSSDGGSSDASDADADVRDVRTGGLPTNGRSLTGLVLDEPLLGIDLSAASLNGTLPAPVRRGDAPWNELVAADLEGAGGTTRSGADLVGDVVAGVRADGSTVRLTIASYERSGDVAYYTLTRDGRNVCGEGEKGMFVPGVWDARAARRDSLSVGRGRSEATYSCTTGALAKCVTWGFAPWTASPAVHQACTRMVRADYCGAGDSYTKDGTPIVAAAPDADLSGDGSFAFEAGWNQDGAVCASRPRLAADETNEGGGSGLPSCWSSLPQCASASTAVARGATIVNGSRRQ
jgi:hypothetical protein